MRINTSWNGHHIDSVIQQLPTNFIRNGIYNEDTPNSLKALGYYWHGDNNRIANAYLFAFGPGYSNPGEYYKGYGFSIRCLVR